MSIENLTFLLKTERKRLNEIFSYTDEQVDSICDQEILSMYFTLCNLFGFVISKKFNSEISERSIEILKKLKDRGVKLRAIELKKINRPKSIEVIADCGCYVMSSALMSTSTGTSCANCFDRMSL